MTEVHIHPDLEAAVKESADAQGHTVVVSTDVPKGTMYFGNFTKPEPPETVMFTVWDEPEGDFEAKLLDYGPLE